MNCDQNRNPLCGVSPDISVLGVEFSNAVNVVLAAIWGIVLIYIVVRLLLAIGKWAYHSMRTRDEDAIEEGAGGVKKAFVAFLVCLGVGFLLTIGINVVQTIFPGA